jgi:hypothetical protein
MMETNATSQKVMGLRPDEVTEFFSIYLILPATLGPGTYSSSNRNECQKQIKMFLWRRALSVCKADNLITIYKPTLQTVWDFQHLTIVYASTASYRDSPTSLILCNGNYGNKWL